MPKTLALGLCAFYVCICFVYLFGPPLLDEGWFASPPYNLLHHGNLGTTTIDPTGYLMRPELTRIDQRTYWVLPFSFLAQSAWYFVTGFGLFQMRLLSVLFGAAGAFAIYRLMIRLTGDQLGSAIATLLFVQDNTILFRSANGRMDVMCLGLGLVGQAAYVSLRKRSLPVALLTSGTFLSLALLTHPNAIISVLTVIATALILDAPRLKFSHIVPFAAPFLVGGLLYAAWAARDLVAFKAQLTGNHASERMQLLDPIHAITEEIIRYRKAFYKAEYEPGAFAPFKLILLAAWFGGFIGNLAVRGLRDRATIVLAASGLIPVVVLTFFNAKNMYYLVFIVPFFAANAGMFFSYLWQKRGNAAKAAMAGLALTLLVSAAVNIKRAVAVPKGAAAYRQRVAAIKTVMPPQGKIMGPATLAFGLGFDRVVQDDNLGFFSHRCPGLIVDDGLQPDETDTLRRYAPNVLEHRNQMLTVHYRMAQPQIYERLSCPAGSRAE
jgi:4-amino-4-deoxy-L-arabinose transferase-like glycosyltransferase